LLKGLRESVIYSAQYKERREISEVH